MNRTEIDDDRKLMKTHDLDILNHNIIYLDVESVKHARQVKTRGFITRWQSLYTALVSLGHFPVNLQACNSQALNGIMKKLKKNKISQQVRFRQTTLDESTFLVKHDVSGDSDHDNQERPGSPHDNQERTRARSKGVTDHRAEEGVPSSPPAGPSGVGDGRPSHSRACKRARPHQSAEYVGDTSETDTAVTDQEYEELWSPPRSSSAFVWYTVL